MSNISAKSRLIEWYSSPVDGVFFDQEQSRREWQPSPIYSLSQNPATNSVIPQAFFKTLSRVVALALNLELPVGAFISALLEEEVPTEAKRGLFLNIKDEERHQLAFEYLAKVISISPQDLATASEFRKALIKYTQHPLAKARDIETVIFIPIQAWIRFYSKIYGLDDIDRTIAAISHDELRHLNYNWALSQKLNIKIDKEFNKALVKISEWVFEPSQELPISTKFWLDATKDMVAFGKSERLKNLTLYGIHVAPFEVRY